MPDLKKADLKQLREKLGTLVSDLEGAVRSLSEDEQRSYQEAEESVVDARRKAETHEGLLQVN
jgi:hypothetical protein